MIILKVVIFSKVLYSCVQFTSNIVWLLWTWSCAYYLECARIDLGELCDVFFTSERTMMFLWMLFK